MKKIIYFICSFLICVGLNSCAIYRVDCKAMDWNTVEKYNVEYNHFYPSNVYHRTYNVYHNNPIYYKTYTYRKYYIKPKHKHPHHKTNGKR